MEDISVLALRAQCFAVVATIQWHLEKNGPSKLITQLAYSTNLSRHNRLSMTKESVWGAVTERIDCRRLRTGESL